MNQVEFSDLDDEIVAEDWLVHRNEISRRRLFKRTPRYNIYKADWFGDVLVYEPTSPPSASRRPTVSARKQEPATSSWELELAENSSRTEELRLRLANLDLDIHHRQHQQHNSIPIRKPQGSLADSDQADSAYSSISSTPHYRSKNLNSEFEFPQSSCSPSLSVTTVEDRIATTTTKANSPRAQVILNKDSYIFNFGDQDLSNDKQETTHDEQESDSSTWRELNELRLIAHESFMLFMGASVDECYDAGSLGGAGASSPLTSLVMQMNHPKAVSLQNLLHKQQQQHQHQFKSAAPIDSR